MDKINETLRYKLQSLLTYLSEITGGFESIAEEIDCNNLKTALIAVSAESKQYADEINDQLIQFKIAIPLTQNNLLWQQIESNTHEQAAFSKGGEIDALCNNCEFFYTSLYKDILQEYFPQMGFKEIIIYQFYATRCAFMKIRLLNKLRFNNNT